MNAKNKYIKYFYGLVLTFAVLFFLSCVTNISNDKNIMQNDKTNTEEASAKLGNTTLKATYHYICGHDEYSEGKIPEKYYNKNIEELKKMNTDINVISFKDNILVAEIFRNTKCSKHYYVRLTENLLYIFCMKNPNQPEEVKNLNLIGLYEDELERLKQGIEFSNKEELLEFLEDFES